MSAFPAADPVAPDASRSWDPPRRIAIVRAVLALAWAAALVIAVGGEVPSTSSDVPIAAAALLASYPAIDIVASIAGALGTGASARALRVNAAIGVLAVVAIGAAAFGDGAGPSLPPRWSRSARGRPCPARSSSASPSTSVARRAASFR
jgi:hypothetical protein